MTWVRIDDQFFMHPKAIAAGRDGKLLFFAGLCWCGSQLTDGRIPKPAVATIAALAGVKPAAARHLVAAGLWHDTGEAYEVHDYLVYQKDRSAVTDRRAAVSAARSAAGAKGGQQTASKREANGQQTGSNGQAPSHPIPSATSNPSSSNLSEGSPPDDDGSEQDPIVLAFGLLADRAIDRQRAAGKLLTNPKGYRDSCVASARSDHGHDLALLHRRHPAWTPEQLADAIDPPAHISRPAPLDPVESARRRGAATAGMSNADAEACAQALDTDADRDAFWTARKAAQ